MKGTEQFFCPVLFLQNLSVSTVSAKKLFAGSGDLCICRFPAEGDLHDAVPAALRITTCQKPGLPFVYQPEKVTVFQNGKKVFKKKTNC